ncbi:MAG: hypothetical protein ACE3JN_14770 [Ectobacillus sp.]
MLIWNERRWLQREKRLGPARGKRPPVVENQQPSLPEPLFIAVTIKEDTEYVRH